MPVDLRPPSPFRGRGEVMEAAGGGKRNAIVETKHSRRAMMRIFAARVWSYPACWICLGAAASQDPARSPGPRAKTGNAPMQALGWGRRRLLEPAILVFWDANRGRTELGQHGSTKYFCAGLTQNQGEHRLSHSWDEQRDLVAGLHSPAWAARPLDPVAQRGGVGIRTLTRANACGVPFFVGVLPGP